MIHRENERSEHQKIRGAAYTLTLIAAGKEKKVALTAIMRKIIVMANALIRDGRQWTATRA
jgi:hypothetical protein